MSDKRVAVRAAKGETPAGALTTFGAALRAARRSAGLTQEELAELSGLDRTYVSGAERGIRNPTLATLDRLAGALGLSVPELLETKDGPGRK